MLGALRFAAGIALVLCAHCPPSMAQRQPSRAQQIAAMPVSVTPRGIGAVYGGLTQRPIEMGAVYEIDALRDLTFFATAQPEADGVSASCMRHTLEIELRKVNESFRSVPNLFSATSPECPPSGGCTRALQTTAPPYLIADRSYVWQARIATQNKDVLCEGSIEGQQRLNCRCVGNPVIGFGPWRKPWDSAEGDAHFVVNPVWEFMESAAGDIGVQIGDLDPNLDADATRFMDGKWLTVRSVKQGDSHVVQMHKFGILLRNVEGNIRGSLFFVARSSAACTQSIELYSQALRDWVAIDSRSIVGTTDAVWINFNSDLREFARKFPNSNAADLGARFTCKSSKPFSIGWDVIGFTWLGLRGLHGNE